MHAVFAFEIAVGVVALDFERAGLDAYLVARSPNPLASVCGRVCAAPCEDACRRGADGDWEPCGNPVKDAMATKVFEDARDIAAILYAPARESAAPLEACAARFAELLRTECGAIESGFSLVG